MPVVQSIGAREWSKTQRQIQRTNVPVNYWHKKGPTLHFGLEKWRVWWIPRVGARRGIGHLVESLSWTDERAVMTGELHLREPAFASTGIGNGDEIMLECATDGGGSFQEIWRLRVWQMSPEYKGDSNTVQLTNALGWLARSTDDFKYVKNKHRLAGWRADEIAKDICRRYAVPIGNISQGKHRIKRFVYTSISPLLAIAYAYQREAAAEARWFVFSMRHGKLDIVPLQRNSRLLELGPLLFDAMFQQTLQETFATAVTVRGTARAEKGKDAKGKKKKQVAKLVVKVQSPASIKRFGYIHRNLDARDADSLAEARRTGLRSLVRTADPQKLLTLSHPGIPTLKRGDAIRVSLPDDALQQLLYVTSIVHNLSAANYTMDLQVKFTDPVEDARLARVKAKRAGAAKRAKRKPPKTADKKKPKATEKDPPKKTQHTNKTRPGDRLTGMGHPGTKWVAP